MTRHVRTALVLAMIAAAAPAAGTAGVAASVADLPANADFNDDGYADLAVAAAKLDVDGVEQAGGVYVLLGTATGLSGVGSRLLTRATPGVPQAPADAEWLGMSLAHGDFDGDGFDDLALGAPYGDVGSGNDRGSVTVVRGSAAGLTGAGSTLWSEGSTGVPGKGGASQLFGAGLLAADFDDDGHDDLAIGVPRDVTKGVSGGTVRVLYGSPDGLGADRDAVRLRPRGLQASDYFGNALSAGDFDGDGYPELAVGAPERDVKGVPSAGDVRVFAAGANGLATRPYQTWSARTPGVKHPLGAYATFGSSLSAGDLDGDGRDDLVASAGDGNYVRVLFASAAGLTADASQYWDRDAIGLPVGGTSTSGFGGALVIADLTGDGRAELVIGDAAQAVDDVFGGVFYVLHGSIDGPTSVGAERWHQDSAGVGDEPEHLEGFGSELVASDVNDDGQRDIITGIPLETVEDGTAAGMVQMLFRSADGTTFTGDQRLTQLSPGVEGEPKWPNGFGGALAG